jgi:hypothetical protein
MDKDLTDEVTDQELEEYFEDDSNKETINDICDSIENKLSELIGDFEVRTFDMLQELQEINENIKQADAQNRFLTGYDNDMLNEINENLKEIKSINNTQKWVIIILMILIILHP